MNLILCLDNKNGISFCGKRQSRDRVLCEKILEITAGAVLRMRPYSASLFSDLSRIVVEEDAIRNSRAGDWCFVEDGDFLPHMAEVSRIILFKWNRDYPADRYFSYDLPGGGWHLTTVTSFVGYSHDEITMEVYER